MKLALAELETDEAGMADALTVSRYMEELADSYGRKFAQARAQFDYDFVKMAYRECFLQGEKV